mgnify:CR=1 FL=1
MQKNFKLKKWDTILDQQIKVETKIVETKIVETKKLDKNFRTKKNWAKKIYAKKLRQKSLIKTLNQKTWDTILDQQKKARQKL